MLLDEPASRVDCRLRVKRDEHVTVPVDPLGYARNPLPGQDRLRVDGPDPVTDPATLRQWQGVFEARGGDEPNPDTGTRREDIGHRGRTEPEAGDPREELGERGARS